MALRSRTSSCASSSLLALFALLLAVGCSSKRTAIAELRKADGPVERQVGTGAWAGAKIGTKYYLNDAARTADGGAQLEVVGNALIAMQPHTILRFGGTDKSSKIAVELGTIELTGTGSKLDAFLTAIEPGTILETVRTGASGIGRGERILRV
jgi:hypothetical protein